MQSVKELEAALKGYLSACYGDVRERPGKEQFLNEVRQAFLSGIYWRDTESLPPGDCEPALRRMLGMDRDRN